MPKMVQLSLPEELYTALLDRAEREGTTVEALLWEAAGPPRDPRLSDPDSHALTDDFLRKYAPEFDALFPEESLDAMRQPGRDDG
jgi:hypothetical protein